eukprot:11189936-Karenia_brevis.AAC.1
MPEMWRQTFITLLHKKGDTRQPGNYRPISLLPIMYKLFSRVLRSRIQKKLDEAQNGDQAGFRSGYSCDDHLLTIVLLIEKCSEYQLPLW